MMFIGEKFFGGDEPAPRDAIPDLDAVRLRELAPQPPACMQSYLAEGDFEYYNGANARPTPGGGGSGTRCRPGG